MNDNYPDNGNDYPDDDYPDNDYPDDEKEKWPTHVVHTGGNKEIDGGSLYQGNYCIPDEDPDPDYPDKPPPDEDYTYVYWQAECSITDITNGVEYNEEGGYFEVPAGVTEFSFWECTTYEVYAWYDDYDDTWYFWYI